ncbi:MAG: anthranilate phosphoribosyltransferase [Thaumarchaeota archaeon]|nr:anthranilate phosphoribosyltransferase [Nitrososphaerota archaeon]
MIVDGIRKLVERQDLTESEAHDCMTEIVSGQATAAQIAAFLTALQFKGETVQEITSFARVMRENSIRITPKVSGRLVDTCGTGGDIVKSFNVSTAAAIVIAGAGVHVAKHGNRSVTSKSGSADVLESLGVNLDVSPSKTEEMIEQIGIGFLFAPKLHPAMKYAREPRMEIGIRTVFNILGPLTNPARADAQVLGVYSESLVEPMAEVARNLGSKEAIVVHGSGGLDEISTFGPTKMSWVREGNISTSEVTPETFGIAKARPEEIVGAGPEENAKYIIRILKSGIRSDIPRGEMILVNAAAGIIVGGRSDNFLEAIEIARESIDSGNAFSKLKALIVESGGDTSKMEELEGEHE